MFHQSHQLWLPKRKKKKNHNVNGNYNLKFLDFDKIKKP